MIKFFKGIFERSRITRNTTPKIIAILVAIVFYIFVMGEVNPEVEKKLNNLQVELLNKEELDNLGLVFIDQNEFTVDVRVLGKKTELPQISLDDIKVSADLSGAKQGENSIVLDVSKPVNVEIKDVTPQQIIVRLDKIVQSQKPVEIVYKGSPAKGYEIGEHGITPDEILIEGPQTKVESVAKVVAEVDVAGAKENIRKNVPPRAVDSQGNDIVGVEVKAESVNVHLSVLKLKNVAITHDIKGEVKDGYKITKIEIEPANVTLKAKEGIVNGITEVSTKSINVDGLDSTLETEINLNLPSYIETPSLQGLPKIRIEVEKIETKEFTFKANQISVTNLKNTLTTNIGKLDKDIKVKISDVGSVLDEVRRSDLELKLDLGGLDEGTHTMLLDLNKSGRYENIEIEPKEIEIQIYNKDEVEEVDAIGDGDSIPEETNEIPNDDTNEETNEEEIDEPKETSDR
ncbi:CdaR family protein [Wukongibacter baidiensis]|uniref:CdaR family protein n=1 Tax=Wukongibacter baidiensis TaxID=1723361 RepID=UPI003D7FEED4